MKTFKRFLKNCAPITGGVAIGLIFVGLLLGAIEWFGAMGGVAVWLITCIVSTGALLTYIDHEPKD